MVGKSGRFAILEDVWHSVRVSRDHGKAARHCLEWRGRLTFAPRWFLLDTAIRADTWPWILHLMLHSEAWTPRINTLFLHRWRQLGVARSRPQAGIEGAYNAGRKREKLRKLWPIRVTPKRNSFRLRLLRWA